MMDEQYKMLKEWIENNKTIRNKIISSIKPSGSASTITGSVEFSSLYPSTMVFHFGARKRIIKAKRILKNIKHDIE